MSSLVGDSRRHIFSWRGLAAIICIMSKWDTPRLMLLSVAMQAGLSLTWLQTSEDRFSGSTTHIDIDKCARLFCQDEYLTVMVSFLS